MRSSTIVNVEDVKPRDAIPMGAVLGVIRLTSDQVIKHVTPIDDRGSTRLSFYNGVNVPLPNGTLVEILDKVAHESLAS